MCLGNLVLSNTQKYTTTYQCHSVLPLVWSDRINKLQSIYFVGAATKQGVSPPYHTIHVLLLLLCCCHQTFYGPDSPPPEPDRSLPRLRDSAPRNQHTSCLIGADPWLGGTSAFAYTPQSDCQRRAQLIDWSLEKVVLNLTNLNARGPPIRAGYFRLFRFSLAIA